MFKASELTSAQNSTQAATLSLNYSEESIYKLAEIRAITYLLVKSRHKTAQLKPRAATESLTKT